jgi:DNA-binding beta-propeller fold protein YncE
LGWAQDKAELSLSWQTESVFMEPESASIDPDTGHIFVSNVNRYAKDGNGFISKVSADGQAVDVRWLAGLDSPTGLTISEGLLYAVDYDQLVVVDISKGVIVSRYPAPDVNPALNDVVVSPSGVFVSGSLSNSIYMLSGSELVVWRQDDEVLKYVNGLYVIDETLVVGGQRLYLFDIKTKQQFTTEVTDIEAISGVDGIAEDECGRLLVTLLEDDRIWSVDLQTGSAKPLSESRVQGIDLSYHQGRLAVPRVGGSLGLYSVSPEQCAQTSR